MEEVNDKVKKVKKPPTSGSINISDAEVIEEVKNNTKNESEDHGLDTEYVKNLKDQKTVDLSEAGKSKSSEKVVIDFMNEEHIKNFTSSESKKSDENEVNTNSQFDGKSVEDLRSEIKKAEDDSKKNFTAKDFEDIAKFIIFLIDTGLSSALKWWSKDTSDAAYSLPEKKKDMLVYQLTLILTKYQAKFSVEFMFILTILIVYAPAFMKAKNRRKEVFYNKVEQNEVYQNNNKESDSINNIVKSAEKVANDNPVNTGAKRKRGNPGKA